jgi:ribose 1,5-bisphosphokinase PhnN
VYEIGPSGEGKGFVVQKLEATEGADSDIAVGRRFEGKRLVINMEEGTLLLDGAFFIPGIIAIES